MGPISWVSRSAMFGISTDDRKNRGKGYGQESTNLMLDLGFRTLNLERVELFTFDFNKEAQACYRKVGFKEVGRRRRAAFIDRKYCDDIIMDILKEEWLARTARKFARARLRSSIQDLLRIISQLILLDVYNNEQNELKLIAHLDNKKAKFHKPLI